MTDSHSQAIETPEPLPAAEKAALRLAAETLLRRRLNSRTPSLSTRWCAADGSDGEWMDANDLGLLVSAWLPRDPKAAFELLQTAFAFQQPDGFIPRGVRPTGLITNRGAPWPQFAQILWSAWNRLSDPTPLAELWPRLHRYGGWLIQAYLARPDVPPRWRSEAEAFVPETWDSDLETVDLTVLLLAEMEALAQFADVTGHPKEAEVFRQQQDPLAAHLRATFWDSARGRYADRYAASGPVARATVSALLPLLWNGLDGERRMSILRDYRAGRLPRAGERGIPLWERWPEDEADAPVPLAQQFVLWRALAQAGAAAEAAFLRDRLIERIAADWRRNLAFRDEAAPAASFAEVAAVPPAAQSMLAAALVLCLLDAPEAARPRALESSRPVQWVETHRRGFLVAALAGLLTILIALIWAGYRSRSIAPGTAETAVADALQDLRSGRPASAARRLEAVLQRLSAPPPQILYLLGNARYAAKDYAGAEAAYRGIPAQDLAGLRARYNISLCLYRQSRPREALESFSDFIALYGRQFPELARRARLAMILIQHHPDPAAAAKKGGQP